MSLSILGDILNFGLGAANLGYTINANKQARADQQHYYSMTLPAAQMALRRAAGLNPYGDIAQVGANTPTPVNVSDNVANGFQQMSDALNNARSYKLAKIASDVQLKSLLLQEKRLDKDLEVADANIKNLGVQNENLRQQNDLLREQTDSTRANTLLTNTRREMQELENEILRATKQNRIDISTYEVQQAFENVQQAITNNKWLPLLLSASYRKTEQEIVQMLKDLELTDKQIEKIGYDIKQAGFDAQMIDQLNDWSEQLGKDNKGKPLMKAIVMLAKVFTAYLSRSQK